MSLTPKNWDTFQHYKDRKPPWIKLHRGLLDDYAFACLPVASQALAPRIWLLASEYEGGKITATLDEIAFRLHLTIEALTEALKPLVKSGFLDDASGLLAACKQSAMPEREREEETQEQKEEEKISPSLRSGALALLPDDGWPKDFREQFWKAYPRKAGKLAAIKSLERVRKSGSVPFERLMAAIAKIPTADPQFIPHPATWLNQGRWDDEQIPGGSNGQGRPRALQDDSRSASKAADRLIEQAERGEFTFGPRPSLLSEGGPSAVRLLSKG